MNLYDQPFIPPDMSDPDRAFQYAVDTLSEVDSGEWGDGAFVENARQSAHSILAAYEQFLLSQIRYDVIRCAHCDQWDSEDVGDWDNMVAGCSTCQVFTCGRCWDRLHAGECCLDDPGYDEDGA